jgi:PEP-CTERM motif
MRRDIGTLVKAAFAAMSLVAGIFYISVRSAAADQLAFAVDNTTNLFSVDLTTATATPIGNTGQFLQGLAVSPQGTLFGTDYLGDLFSISKTTGAATLIGDTGLGDIEGLTFRGTTLIGTDFSNLGGPTTVSAINTATAAATPITSFSQGPVRAMALVNTNTIDVASDSPVSQSLVQVNLLTGTNLNLGQLPSNGLAVTGSDLISALNFGTDGVLYALDALGNEFMIASNGAGIPVGNTGGQYWLDLTMASTVLDPPGDPPGDVPEPSSMALLLTAALGLISVRVWQRSRSRGSSQR